MKNKLDVVIDIESDGLAINANIHTVGIYDGKDYGIYSVPRDLFDLTKDIIKYKSKGARFCFHNGLFDTSRMLKTLDIDVPIHNDTLLLAYLMTPVDVQKQNNRKKYFTLENSSVRELGIEPWDIALKDKQGKGDEDIMTEYLKKDLKNTYDLLQHYKKKLPKNKYQIYKLVTRAANAYKYIQTSGLPVDFQGLEETEAKYRLALTSINEEIDTLLDEVGVKDINLNSHQQLSHLLFDVLKLPVISITCAGNRSTGVEVLKMLEGKHKITDLILQRREIMKALQFLEEWKEKQVGGKIYADFNLYRTVSGRTSCNNPNLQQIPRNKALKSLFRSTNGAWELAQLDYSQMELRVAGIVGDIDKIKEAYSQDKDLHTEMAADITNKNPEDITKQDRTSAKAANFGYLYGMAASGFVTYAKMTFGIDMTEPEAKALRASFFATYPELPPYYKYVENALCGDGRITNLFGRHYEIDPQSLTLPPERRKYFRSAINFTVQSTASDYALCAIIEIAETMPRSEIKMCATVHDSIIFLIKKNENFENNLRRLQKIMEKPKLVNKMIGITFDIPIKVDIELGPWGSGVSLEKYLNKEAYM